ncbi:hypothetical protein O181_061920 [Austropuccinia psidii MF-1]|uniref:Uncharacterized protein n=1 Tax=Austropuccinia psidii MF-1 TaxID=1389203 RepID=A0A9Q3I0X4_9BASI|nr:hypothetical protein [Austropuccinia psidii MF-1]
MAIEPVGPKFGHGPPWTIFQAMASGNHQMPPNQLSKLSLQLKGNSSIPPCTPYSRLQEWTKFHNSKSRSQNPMPILKEDSLTHQSGNPWRQSEDHSRIPITWSCRRLVGNFIQDYSKAILRSYTVFQAVVKASSISILLGQLNWSIQASTINLYVLGPIGAIQSHSSISRWPERYWPSMDNTAGDPPSKISLSVLHIYLPPFSTSGLFP